MTFASGDLTPRRSCLQGCRKLSFDIYPIQWESEKKTDTLNLWVRCAACFPKAKPSVEARRRTTNAPRELTKWQRNNARGLRRSAVDDRRCYALAKPLCISIMQVRADDALASWDFLCRARLSRANWVLLIVVLRRATSSTTGHSLYSATTWHATLVCNASRVPSAAVGRTAC